MGLLSASCGLALLALFCPPQDAPEPPGWDAFPAFVWRQDHRGRALPDELARPFGATNVERADGVEWMDEAPLAFYVGHAPGRDDLHLRRTETYERRFEAWYRTRDEGQLVREPCLTDPKTRERLFVTLETSLAARGGNHGLGISLGDEVSLTPWGDPLDLCRSETCEAAWRGYAAERGWPERAPTTDEIRLTFGDGDTEGLGAWLARRHFHQEIVLDLLEDLAGRARELAPGTPVGLLGLGGRTAFGGVAVERAAAFLDFLEPYPTDDARELLASVRLPHHRSLVTIFPVAEAEGGPDAAAARVWEHFLRGGDGAVLWSDRTLAQRPKLRERLGRAVTDVRRVCERVGPFRPHVGGVGLVHSPDSAAIAWLRDALLDGPTWPNRLAGYQRQNGTRERSLRSWLRLLEDVGLLPGAVPVDSVGADTVERFPLLVFSHVAVLSQEEVGGLEAFLAAGGRIVVEPPFAELDPRGLRRDAPLLENLADRFPEGLVPLPEAIEDYAHLREELNTRHFTGAADGLIELSVRDGLEPHRSAFVPRRDLIPRRGRMLQAEVAGWREVRAHRAPFRILDRSSRTWLVAYQNRGDATLGVALPSGRAHLERQEEPAARFLLEPGHERPPLIVEVPDGMTLEWLHPAAPGEDVPSGDALVFRLRPE